MNLSGNDNYKPWFKTSRPAMAFCVLLWLGCTKDHRIADQGTNVHGHLVLFAGCTRFGIQAGSTRFLVRNDINSFLAADSLKSGNVIFSYKNLQFGPELVCQVDGDFIDITAIRSDD